MHFNFLEMKVWIKIRYKNNKKNNYFREDEK